MRHLLSSLIARTHLPGKVMFGLQGRPLRCALGCPSVKLCVLAGNTFGGTQQPPCWPVLRLGRRLDHLPHLAQLSHTVCLCRPNFESPDRTLSRPSGLLNSSELGRQLARRLSNQLRRIMSVRSTQDQDMGDEENGGGARGDSPRSPAEENVTVASTVSNLD